MLVPRVSVVMAVYNAAPFLTEAVCSVLAQTVEDLELIVVDDGSTDGSADIVASMARRDGRVRLHRQTHGGLVSAITVGCEYARAEYIARMDADDVAAPQRLRRQLEVLETRPRLVLLGTAVVVMDAAGRAHYTIAYPETDGEIRRSILHWNCFAHPTVVMRAQALRAVGGYRRAFLHAEDYDLWLRLIEVGEVANLSEPLVYLRTHEGQVTQAFLEQQVMSRLAAAAMARRRASGRPDPLLSTERVTMGTLVDLGVGSECLREELVAAFASRAADLTTQGQSARANGLLQELRTQPWAQSRWRRVLATYHWACARNALSMGAFGRGVLAAARATTLAPTLPAAWLTRKAGRVVRGARIVPQRRAHLVTSR